MESKKKETYKAGLVVGILSIFFGPILGIIGIVLNAVNKDKYNVKAGLICSIVGTAEVIVIGIIAAFVTSATNSYMTSTVQKQCCINYGGFWMDNGCYVPNGDGTNEFVSEDTYFDEEQTACKW